MSSLQFTLIGFFAILMWSLLALLTVASGDVPPFQLAAMTFAIGGTIGAAWVTWSGSWGALKQSPRAWALGIGGLFGYHALYFIALRLAPPAEAALMNYLWPLLIVLFSGLLPGERLRWFSVIGAVVGFAGTALLFVDKGLALSPDDSLGYLAALIAAFIWAGYSVMSRRFASVPTAVVAGFCLATAVLAALCHVALEETVWPKNADEWEAVIALGVLPLGAAFYAWDIGVKRGDIRLLGVASYAAPVLSTLFLVLAGFAQASVTLALSALLIAGGGFIAAKDLLRRKATS